MTYNYERSIAFICPYCSEISIDKVNIFDFSEQRHVQLFCTSEKCEEHCVSIIPKKDKYKIISNCAVCAEQHIFNISKSSFWHKELLSFSCPEASNIEILFIGTQKIIDVATTEALNEISDFEHILFGIAKHLNALLSSGHINCHCGCHDIIPTTLENKIVLECSKCNSRMSIEINEKNLEKLLTSSELII